MLFGGLNANPYNINAPVANPYNIQPQNVINIDGRQIPAQHGEELKQIIDALNWLQVDPHLQNLQGLQYFEKNKELEQVEKAQSDAFSMATWNNQANKDQNQFIKQKCIQIKKRNQKLLVRVMNIRQMLCSQMYMYRVPSKQRALELEQISQKVRDIKYQVKLKYNQIRVLKMNKQQMEDQDEEKRKRPTAIDIPLVQLKKGTEVLEKETLKIHEQFKLLQRLIHGEKV